MTDGLWSQLGAAESMLRESEDKLGRLGQLQASLAELVGRAETADGKVVAEFTHGEGLTVLEIDPRAMRMASTDLAAAVQQAVVQANENLRWKVAEAVAASGSPTSVTPQAAQQQVAEMRRELIARGRAAAEGFERASAVLKQRGRG